MKTIKPLDKTTVPQRPTRQHAALLTEADLLEIENDPEYKHIWDALLKDQEGNNS